MDRTNFIERVPHGTPDFPVGIYTYHGNAEMVFHMHYHTEFEFLLITRGSVTVQLDNTSIHLLPGESIFINSGILHSAVSSDNAPWEFKAIVFSHAFLAHETEIIYKKYIRPVLNKCVFIPPRLNADASRLIEEITTMNTYKKPGYELVIKSNLAYILSDCLSQMKYTNQKPDNKMIITKDILDYIHAHFHEKITLDDISSDIHISKEHICRIFKEVSGMSPFVYINKYRITQSMDMIINTNKTITEIAQNCGFSNSSYFNKIFLRFTGCTPLNYKKK